MSQSRIDIFTKMLDQEPGNTTVRFGLANELIKAESWGEAVEQLKRYLAEADDQGAAYGKLAIALERLGRIEEARSAYVEGIAIANSHGHPGMAQEFQLALDDLL